MKCAKFLLLSVCLIITAKTFASQAASEAFCDSSDSEYVELPVSNNNYNKKSLLRMRNTGIVQKSYSARKSNFFWGCFGVLVGLLFGIPLLIIATDIPLALVTFFSNLCYGNLSIDLFVLPNLINV
jgi:hypothetical protein